VGKGAERPLACFKEVKREESKLGGVLLCHSYKPG